MQPDQELTLYQETALAPLITNLSQMGEAAAYAARNIDYLSDHKAASAKETLRRYRYDLKHFEAFLQSAANVTGQHLALDLFNTIHAWEGMTMELLLAYKKSMEDEGLAVGTIGNRIYTVRAFCKVAVQAKVISETAYARICLVKRYTPRIADNLDANRRAQGKPTRKPQGNNAKKEVWTLLTVAQIKALLRACGDDRRSLRDRFLILLAFKLGLRVGEVVRLTLSSLNEETGLLTFDRPKTHLKNQHQELQNELLVAARDWLTVRRKETDDPLAPLFNAETLPGQAINEGTVSHRIALLAWRVLGLKHVSYHDGRHWFVDDAIENQVNIKVLTEAGGWVDPRTPLRLYASKAHIANKGMTGTSLAV